jgi:predicted DNA-binding transcriptional regulator AlpA
MGQGWRSCWPTQGNPIMSEPNIIRIERGTGSSRSSRSDAPTRFLSLRQVLDRTSISRSLVYQLIKDEERPFPAPVHIAGGAFGLRARSRLL